MPSLLVGRVSSLLFGVVALSAGLLCVTQLARTRQPAEIGNIKLKLRFDWTNIKPLTPFARAIHVQQSTYSIPLADFHFRNVFGMGSDFHLWTQAMCNAMSQGYRVRSAMLWTYHATKQCAGMNANATEQVTEASSMTCYFPQSELLRPEDADPSFPVNGRHRLDRRGNVDYQCGPILEKYNQTVSDLRAAGIEYLFGKVSRFVQEVGTRQLNAVFGHIDSVPSNLITVHLRWGDKGAEMSLVPVEAYIEAIESILANRAENTKRHDRSVNIFLATENPAAVEAFMKAGCINYNQDNCDQ
ncbi:hypothetical protein MPSEU_000395000 [Mayamaea pseudoterrestris]|nr:hypothetical protein MPSEU_000395000 [Mayamaea pseudoterrestris]